MVEVGTPSRGSVSGIIDVCVCVCVCAPQMYPAPHRALPKWVGRDDMDCVNRSLQTHARMVKVRLLRALTAIAGSGSRESLYSIETCTVFAAAKGPHGEEGGVHGGD